MHHHGIGEPDRLSTIRGRFPNIERAFEIGLMKEDILAVSAELRPISIAQTYAELPRTPAVRAHSPNMPIAASVGMKCNGLAIERRNRTIVSANSRSELP